MISLKKITIHKYKCVESEQSFEVDKNITVLVGMNESGKTSVLEALAKTNYFTDDSGFVFNTTHDYPRKEKKRVDKSGVVPVAVTSVYEVSDELINRIESDLGEGVYENKSFSRVTDYDNKGTWSGVVADFKGFIQNQTAKLGISSDTLNEKLFKAKSVQDLEEVKEDYKDEKIVEGIGELLVYFENKWGWEKDPISEYVARTYLKPYLPKYLYYDEFYSLPSRISIEGLLNESLEENEQKTAKALFDLADIDINELINSSDFEDFKAELEATEATITEELFKYWSTNTNLEIQFDIDKVEKTDPQGNKRIVEHVLDIRVKNARTRVSLPLKNRSKGFNWFFSFLVWFKKIQEDAGSNYILLLDEPGLNLHASAQADLLEFIEHLSSEYQVLYSTHSPFMVDSSELNRVRTVVETENGSVISDSVQEKDPKTLFPLQAALGYDIAQNLFISKNNLLVEGVSDLIYLQVMSGVLQGQGKTSLREDITIVPVGGLDKVSTFVSLLRGSSLNIVCLLDSSIDVSSKSKLENLIREKIIHKKKILFFDEFVSSAEADIEDLFSKADYLSLFNEAFSEYAAVNVSDLKADVERVILQLNMHLGIERFNHYRPANVLAKKGVEMSSLSGETVGNFEKIFESVNSMFK